jgi:glycosyltransferase involved in cell wall biosynthesis
LGVRSRPAGLVPDAQWTLSGCLLAMAEPAELLVIIPAFNEERNLPAVIQEIRAAQPGAQILVVDDGSRDRTVEVARASGARVVSLPFNMGYGAAVQTGFRFAVRGGFERLVILDGDGQHDPRSIDPLLSALAKVDVVRGSRFLGAARYRIPLARRVGMMLFGAIAGFFTGERVTDVTSGFQALNDRAARFLAENYPTDYPDADTVILMKRAGLTTREVPVEMRDRFSGTPMVSWVKSFYYVFKMCLSILVTLLREKPRLNQHPSMPAQRKV